MTNIIDNLAEKRIREALEKGAFEDLPGAGRPLELDDDSMVPEECRAVYRVLKNSGYLPPELEARKEIHTLQNYLVTVQDEVAKAKAMKRLEILLNKASLREGGDRFDADEEYYRQMVERLAR